jgi:hypothetical protein
MGIAPHVEPLNAGDSRRVLPEVKIIVPLGRRRELPANDREFDVERLELLAFCKQFVSAGTEIVIHTGRTFRAFMSKTSISSSMSGTKCGG